MSRKTEKNQSPNRMTERDTKKEEGKPDRMLPKTQQEVKELKSYRIK